MRTALFVCCWLLALAASARSQAPDVVVTGGPSVQAGQTARVSVLGSNVDQDLGVLVEIGGLILPDHAVRILTTENPGEVLLLIDVPPGTAGSTMVVTVTSPAGSTSTSFAVL